MQIILQTKEDTNVFDNYGQYARDILDAAQNMSPKASVKFSKMAAGAGAAAVLCVGSMMGGNAMFAHAQVQEALESVSSSMTESTIVVEVDDADDTSLAAMLSDRPNNLSPKDEAAISERIRNSITDDVLAGASGSFNADGKLEIEMTTTDGIPIVVKLNKTEEGSYSIDEIVAKLDAEQAKNKKQEVSASITTDETKAEYEKPLGVFEEMFGNIAGIAEDTDDETRTTAYDEQMIVLADNLVLARPSSFSAQTTDNAPSEESASNEETGKADKPEEKLAADSVEPYTYIYKGEDGSILSIRAENLGAAFTSMNGLDGINKMKEYWVETATSVATGANQTLKNEEAGFGTEVFYDRASGMWGYFGHVEFTDGTRDVMYNRVVFIDELADQLITVSYRHDCAVDAGSAMTLDAFKSMFMGAPIDVSQDSVVEVEKSPARKVYEDKLYQIQILSGQSMTEPARIAKEEANRAAEEAAAAEGEAGAAEGENE